MKRYVCCTCYEITTQENYPVVCSKCQAKSFFEFYPDLAEFNNSDTIKKSNQPITPMTPIPQRYLKNEYNFQCYFCSRPTEVLAVLERYCPICRK